MRNLTKRTGYIAVTETLSLYTYLTIFLAVYNLKMSDSELQQRLLILRDRDKTGIILRDRFHCTFC